MGIHALRCSTDDVQQEKKSVTVLRNFFTLGSEVRSLGALMPEKRSASVRKTRSGGFDRLQDEIDFVQATLLGAGHDIRHPTILDGLIGKQSYIGVSAFG